MADRMNSERLKDLLYSYLNETMDQEEFDELLLYIGDADYESVFYESMDHELQADGVKSLLKLDDQEIVFKRITEDHRFSAAVINLPSSTAVPTLAEIPALTEIPASTEVPAERFKIYNKKLLSAAAILIIVAAGLYFSTSLFRTPLSTAHAYQFKPGLGKAVLTLANGSKINLEKAGKGQLVNMAGVQITNTKEGSLVYHVAEQDKKSNSSLNTLQTPIGSGYQVQLPDGTRVWLNAASSLTYPSSFAGAKERRVTLKGEAYFEVAHQKDQPFRVVTPQQILEVLGTHFNLNAYDDEPDQRTTLLEGSVKIKSDGAGQFILKPGQQARVKPGTARIVNVDTETVLAWKNNDFVLKDEDFSAIMRRIARWYNVEIIYDASAPEDLELGGWVSRTKNLGAVLKVIESTGKVHFKVEGRRVTVTK
ncbi:FecR family protein [Pedobacter sp. WC2423]|uniref:FecR family protein n=1 Tax=Pedobacter sp. WC2423 TaxID=3234142 RepID=UPI003466163B